jgi:hypothetical protein
VSFQGNILQYTNAVSTPIHHLLKAPESLSFQHFLYFFKVPWMLQMKNLEHLLSTPMPIAEKVVQHTCYQSLVKENGAPADDNNIPTLS